MSMLASAATKFFSARLRRIGFRSEHPNWQGRAEICERCPIRVIRCGVSYCGTPFLQMTVRDPAIHGCGCVCTDKARDPKEHCPVDVRHHPATTDDGSCSCKWCRLNKPAYA